MSKKWSWLVLVAVFFLLEPAPAVVISEFMADNEQGITDEDGDTSDWIEFYHEGSVPVNLGGWSLSDKSEAKFKWVFPPVTMEPGDFLLVYASGKNRREPTGPLHTNFNLAEIGDSLLLRTAFGDVVSLFAPEYPEQVPDVSYGLAMETRVQELIAPGATAWYFVPATADLEATWMAPEFDHNAWQSGPGGIGFDQRATPTFADLIKTDVSAAMRGTNPSIYIRIPFTLAADDLSKWLEFKVKYADGLAVYLNGTLIIREFVTGTGAIKYNTRASKARAERDALAFASYPLDEEKDLLRVGENVLAIQLMNNAQTDDDCFVLPVLEAVELVGISKENRQFFPSPTPLRPNAPGVAGMAVKPVLSVPTGTHYQNFDLTITAPGGGEIRYTTTGLNPTETSELYTAPIAISATRQVRARVFQPGFLPSPVVMASYVMMNEALYNTTSNLPIVIVNTLGGQPGGCDIATFGAPMHIYVVDRDAAGDNLAHMSGAPNYAGVGGIKRRGSSTCGESKGSFKIEIHYEYNIDREPNVSILGFPEESNFLLQAAHYYDPSMLRNPLIYELSNQCGRYAVRTRFIELWLNTTNGQTTTAHYQGVYSFMETIKRNEGRVNIAKLAPWHDKEPEISGGYIVKVDRADPGEPQFSVSGQGSMCWVDPDYPVNTGSVQIGELTTVQQNWLIAYLNSMAAAIGTRNPRNYEKFIDIDAWIDHHILMFFPKNVDAFRLSGFMFKDRGKPLEMGPIWDYDRTMGCANDNRDDDPTGWANGCWAGGDCGTPYFTYGWWNTLFGGQPPLGTDEFATRYRNRWRQLRQGPLSTENILAVIDGFVEEIGPAADRNYTKWRGFQTQAFPAAVQVLKNWLVARVNWLDGQFIEPPTFDPPQGAVAAGTAVRINSSTAGEIYYTLDGTDPKAANNTPSANAVLFKDPIAIAANVKIQARLRTGASTWSQISTAVYYTQLPPVVITEVMYNPLPDTTGTYSSPNYFQYIELKNVGNESVDLTKLSLVDKIRFTFANGSVPTLEPGEHVVVCKNRNAFVFRYGDTVKIAGEFLGTITKTTQALKLTGPVGEPLMDFTFSGTWYAEANGLGYSLVIVDPTAPRESWNLKESWRPSKEVGGSPGREDAEGGLQLPGDVSQDGRLTVSDAYGLLRHLYGGSSYPLPCATEAAKLTLADVNGDLAINTADVIYLLSYMFSSGLPPNGGVRCIPIPDCPDACLP